MTTSSTPHVELRGVSKRFGGLSALQNIQLTIERGGIHAVIGENGAGKSTLGKIVAGRLRHDAGSLIVNGREVHYRQPCDALRDRLVAIAQEPTLISSMTVAQNAFLGVESTSSGFLDGRAQRRRYRELDEATGFGIPGDLPVAALSIGDRQKVELLRALARRAELIVMDEPTAALGKDEAARLLQVVDRLHRSGVTIL